MAVASRAVASLAVASRAAARRAAARWAVACQWWATARHPICRIRHNPRTGRPDIGGQQSNSFSRWHLLLSWIYRKDSRPSLALLML